MEPQSYTGLNDRFLGGDLYSNGIWVEAKQLSLKGSLRLGAVSYIQVEQIEASRASPRTNEVAKQIQQAANESQAIILGPKSHGKPPTFVERVSLPLDQNTLKRRLKSLSQGFVDEKSIPCSTQYDLALAQIEDNLKNYPHLNEGLNALRAKVIEFNEQC